jgi:hypothetical protein
LTLLFMIVLLALGTVGLASLSLFQFGARTSAQQDTLQRICTAYQTQNYDLLVAQIDPTPIPPAVPDPFTDAAKQAILSELQALDTSAGTVTQCQAHRLVFASVSADPTHVPYGFTLIRARDPSKQISLTMTLVRQSNGDWKIARDSDFLGIGA